MRAWLDTAGELPCNVKVLVEGEEEIGSPGLAGFLTAHADALRADVLLLADAGNWSVGTPGLTYSLRGLAGVDVRVRALDGPVHSGMAGGVVPDPVLGLARMLATLVDEHGDPAFDGCWDDYARARRRRARPPRRAARATSTASARDWGVRDGVQLAGDPSIPRVRAPLVAARGDGHRHRRPPDRRDRRTRSSPRPRRGSACGSGAGRTRRASTTRCAATSNAGCRSGSSSPSTALDAVPAWHTDPTGWAFDAATRALRAGFGVDPVCMGVGGTIPFVGPFADAFGGIPALLLGPADPSSRIHGEDESLHLGDWHTLIVSEVLLLAELRSEHS